MARNMKKANQTVFERLADLADRDVVRLSESAKYIKTTASEKAWLKAVKFVRNEDLFVDRHRFFALAAFQDDRYILQIGFGPVGHIHEDLLLQQRNAGLFTALVSDLELPLLEGTNLKLEICNEVFLPSQSAEAIGFECSDIEKYFVSYFCYMIAEDSTLRDQDDELMLQKAALYLLGHSPEVIYLNASPGTMESIKTLARLDIKVVPFDRVFRAFIERRYEHAFLDLYRCLEMLFSLKKIDALRSRLNLNSLHLEISADVEDALGWRPVEKNALAEIFDGFPDGLTSSLRACFNNNADVSANVYGLRNECVHFRPLQKKSVLSKQVNWPNLLESMISVIHHAYHVNYRKML